MVDTLAWMGIFLGFAALSLTGKVMAQIPALRKDVEILKQQVQRPAGT